MKITIYTTNTCEFSKKEKDFLTSHNLPYEEKNLETNREFLTEMLAVSNNFAGTPVTRIEKEDGQIMVLKGFTESEFVEALSLTPANDQTAVPAPAEPATPPPVAPPTPVEPTPSVPEPATPPPTVPAEPVTPPAEPVVPPPPPVPPQTPAEAPVQTTPQDAQLNSILNDLQSKSATTPSEPPTPPAPQQPSSNQPAANNLPNIPEPNFG